MSELRDYALSLIDADDILCIEVEAVLDKAEQCIKELKEERDSARNSVLEMVQPAIAPRLCKQWGMKMPKPARIK